MSNKINVEGEEVALGVFIAAVLVTWFGGAFVVYTGMGILADLAQNPHLAVGYWTSMLIFGVLFFLVWLTGARGVKK